MPEILEQNEIDALLSSLAPEPAAGSDATDSSAGARAVDPAAEAVESQVYNFRHPERVSKDQIRALSSVHEVFARNFGAMLSGMLRTIVDVRVVGVEQLTYSEFIHSMPNPTCFVTLKAPPLEGKICLELSPLIVFPIVDRLLGGDNSNVYIPQRSLTSIEWRLIGRLVDRALGLLSEVWRNLTEVRFEIVETESNPQLVHIVAPTEVVVFVSFEIKLGQTAGTMSLCIPYNTIESVLGHLTAQSWFYRPRAPSEQQRQRLARNLARGTIELTAYLGMARVRLSDLRSLAPGDIIPLDKRTSAPLIVCIGGRNKFAGGAGQVRGFRAIRIHRTALGDEPI